MILDRLTDESVLNVRCAAERGATCRSGTSSTLNFKSCQRGSAVLIILVLLAAMSIILLANSTTLRWLKLEIDRVEKQQLQGTLKPKP